MGAVPRQFERVDWQPVPGVDTNAWPFTMPAIAQIVADSGLEIPAGVTILVGENGSGKSTLLEALAASYPRTGATSSYVNLTGPLGSVEDSPLRRCLRARTHPMARRPASSSARRRCTTTSRA